MGGFMNLVTLLPADKYIVINKTILTDLDRKYIVSLYGPIIGSNAVSLYLTLWRDLDRYSFVSIDYSHHHLMTILKLSLETIKEARKSLEAVGLIRTYFQNGNPNSYVYELYSPMNPKEFFANPIFNVVLYNNIGSSEYDLLKKEFSIMNFSLKDYEEITSSFDEVYKSSSDMDYSFEANGRNTISLSMLDQIDFDLLESSMPKGLVNNHTFPKRMKELINELSLVYQEDTLTMVEIIRQCINESGFIDKDNLRIECRKYYQYNHHDKLPTLVYRTQPEYLKNPAGDTSKKGRIIEVFETTSPYDFLKSKYPSGEPTARDLKLLEYLLVDIELKPAVVNVLIDYVLKQNNNKLNNAFIETIAGQWKRLGIETAKDAMATAEKEHQKYTTRLKKDTKTKITVEKPIWFNEHIGKEKLSEEEEQNLESMLKKYED